MKATKKDYEKAWNYLKSNLEPIAKIEISNGDIKHENEVLHKALDVLFHYAKIIETLNVFKGNAGRKTYKENEKVIHIALEEYIESLNGMKPTFTGFRDHWNNPKKYKLPKEDKASNIIKITKDGVKHKTALFNGLGEDKLQKFYKTFIKNKEKRIDKLLELNILDKMAKTKTRLSDFLKMK